MKICLIGPGILPIPPDGWGAVESLMWDYYCTLEKKGHEVKIINTPDRNEILNECNAENWDFVHVHYDQFYDLIPHIECESKGISSHYPYVDQLEKHEADNYGHIFYFLTRNEGFHNFCISKKDRDAFVECGAKANSCSILENGVNFDNWSFNTHCELPNKSVYLAKIEERKRQYKFQSLEGVDFIGKFHNTSFDTSNPNYLGEIKPREKLFSMLTNYANMVLLSTGENGTPLVIKEALACGLGIVFSEYACSELNLDLPFIDLIPEAKIDDLDYINSVIKENRERCIPIRNDIRKYALENFSWDGLVDVYIDNINKIKK
tara:strand:+ start:44 stop:1003 length:960 start_codon:yes stop_codon:yes gene_type:complete